MGKVTYVCATCGGNDLIWDASARWDDKAQTWRLSGVCDNVTCATCDDDTHAEQKDL